jgi:hypothetical protein
LRDMRHSFPSYAAARRATGMVGFKVSGAEPALNASLGAVHVLPRRLNA